MKKINLSMVTLLASTAFANQDINYNVSSSSQLNDSKSLYLTNKYIKTINLKWRTLEGQKKGVPRHIPTSSVEILDINKKEFTPFHIYKDSHHIKPLSSGDYAIFQNEKLNWLITSNDFKEKLVFNAPNGEILNDFDIHLLKNGNYIILSKKRISNAFNIPIIEHFLHEITPQKEIVNTLAISTVHPLNKENYSNIKPLFRVQLPLEYAEVASVALDNNDNYLLSFVNSHTIYNVDRKTGKTLWTIGGLNPTIKNPGYNPLDIHYPSAVSQLKNGNIIFLNHTPFSFSGTQSAVEYKLNLSNSTMKKVWSYSKKTFYPSRFSQIIRHDNGDTTINWNPSINRFIRAVFNYTPMHKQEVQIQRIDKSGKEIFSVKSNDYRLIDRIYPFNK